VFVGSVREHKGIHVLRAAVGALADEGYTLGVTDDPPTDAQDYETWYGTTTIARGEQIVRNSDIVAVPSLDRPFARGQFPVKIVDALVNGRPVVASRVGPIEWALGSGGILVRAGSVPDLAEALRDLRSPAVREVIGGRGREHARAIFGVDVVARTFATVLDSVIG
jgi:glycosyltransferase involved in cell wall biosynthesis